MTTFNITKNVAKSFSLIIPGFVINTTPVARISGVITMTVASPNLTLNPNVAFALSSPVVTVATPTSIVAGPNTYTYYTTATDCYLLSGASVPLFYDTQTMLIMGMVYQLSCKVWIPFVVTLAQGTTIASATINLVCAETSPGIGAKAKIGCELSGNVTAPTTYDGLNSRVMTSNFTIDTNVPVWVAGTTYSYDITTALQEILNISTWASGHTLAVMFMNYGGGEDVRKLIASYENVTYDCPSLVITGP